MNQEFEAIVMGNYAELCIMWRIAHVQDPEQASAFDAKLKSLEAVIEAFGLAMPDLSLSEDAPAFPTPEQPLPAASDLPPSRLPDASTAIPSGPGDSDGVILDD